MKAADLLKRAMTAMRHHLQVPFVVLYRAARAFSASRAPETASSMAFYALFSLFPLLILLVVIASFFLENPQASGVIVRFLGRAIPISRDVIQQILEGVLQARGAMTLVGLVGLIFSASSLFGALAIHVNRAWPTARACPFITRQLIAISLLGLVIVLLVVSILVRVALALIVLYRVLSLRELPALVNWVIAGASTVARWVTACLVFLAMYRWVPRIRVPWRSALLAGLVAGSAWQLAATLFTWYMGIGLVRLDLVYGSLAAIIALMLWFYLTALILLFGAHLSAAIATSSASVTSLGSACAPADRSIGACNRVNGDSGESPSRSPVTENRDECPNKGGS